MSTLDDRVALRHALGMSTTRVASDAAIEDGDAAGGIGVIACLLLTAAGPHVARTIVLHAALEPRDE